MSDTQTDHGPLADDFQKQFEGKVPQAMLDAARAHLESRPLIASNDLRATLTVTGGITGQVECKVADGPDFRGHLWGLAGPAQSAGSLYTDDPERLYGNTSNFLLIASLAYISMVFYDDSGSVLGSFQGGAVTSFAGSYGGTGGWS
jgi:hypothetical protein